MPKVIFCLLILTALHPAVAQKQLVWQVLEMTTYKVDDDGRAV
ncbi:MAG: hypothetical protein U5L96_02690 [Owenweeksia sp.]|nr:hypothetical protein [Owenweeksia sp.]